MQITLTVPPDVLNQLAAQIVESIRREFDALAKISANQPADSTALLTVQMVSKRLNLHQKTITRFIRTGKLNASNHGTIKSPKYRMSEADYRAFYLSNRNT